ncbi:raffinose/stachyose/melibiose transport system substrate-binding protein [Arthrobacter pascens]|uniref:ABC transporter substrate-binding protein n=1 Tax=Arthrobacter pascens TaxID=1677 RepID=UPI00278095A5|nr:extracellular solute-binding protein [Arthrobacter pascens]MDQ0634279.1 raffinose/stachyose/melibiose transport system substrate-binding protein [Arthrobacter pascens]
MSLTSQTTRRGAARILVALTAIAATAGALSGCSPAASNTESKTVTFLSWDTAQVMQPVFDEFEKENPGYTVKASYAPPVPEYIQKLQTQLGSGNGPDVFIITAENKTQIMNGGFAKDLSGEPWISNIAGAARDTYSKDGKVYGAATASWGGGILVNKDLLAKVGYTDAPKTWDDFLALTKKLSAAGITPFYESGQGISVSLAALLGLQNEALDGKMDEQIWAGKTTFEKTWTPALKTWHELFAQGAVPQTVAGLTGEQITQEFEQGKVAMMGTGSWALGTIQQAAPNLKLDFLAVPGTSGESYWAGAVSPGYAINAKAKDPAAAEKFVQFLQSKQGVEIYQKQTQSITTTADYTPTLDPALGTMASAVRDGKFYLPAVSWPDHSDVMSSEATALLQQAIAGKITPEDVAKGMDTKLQSTK